MPSIQLLRLPHAEGLPLPTRMTTHASGFDVVAANTDDIVLAPLQRAMVPTGFCMAIPEGYEVQVRPRSGLAAKHGITCLNTPGTIDADYRGEVKVILVNLSSVPFTIIRGERIAQLIPMAVPMHIDMIETDTLDETERGTGGFGHTGK